MKNKMLIMIAMLSAAVCILLAVPGRAEAATPEEAEAVARSYGWSEDMIQSAWNKYYEDPDAYDSERIDMIIEKIHEAGNQIASTVPYEPSVTIPALSVTSTVTTAAADTNTTAVGEGTASVGGSSGTGADVTPVSDDITLTMPDGTTFTRISAARFIALSYEDKKAYLGTFTPEQQTVIINNLTPQEYRSLMKQLPTDQKADVLNDMTDVASDLGLNLSVDEMTDNNVVVSFKDENGELVAVAQAGDIVQNTGYDRRGVYIFSGILFTAAICGLYIIIKKSFLKTGDANE